MMKAHDLAYLLLQCENVPVVIKSVIDDSKAELVENVSILQNCDSPFEFALFLEGTNQVPLHQEVVIESL